MVKKSAILEIKRDEWLLFRDAKAQNLQLTTKPLAGIKNKGIVTAGVKYSIALSVWINPLNKPDPCAYPNHLVTFKFN